MSVHHIDIDLQLLHLVLQNTHGTVPTGWPLLFFAWVKLCICEQWMYLEYGHNHIVTDSPSKKVPNQQVYCSCYCHKYSSPDKHL